MLAGQPSLAPQERIGRYEVLRKIATGGMAELFLAKQVGMEGFEKVVAIKRILAHLAYDEEFINMFRDEARIVAKLSHPNIVQIYDLGKSDETYFIAMEYIPGRNLSSVAKKARAKGEALPPEYIARCLAQACEGLYYAHTRVDIDERPMQIVHRDISPQNIILSFSGSVKLVDFGIAKAATKIAHTRAGVLKGKYAYMSPEQIKGDEVDARSDLFAAGIVLYELLCGRRPFEKENSIQTLKAIVQEQHVDCRVLNPDIPDALAAIIDKALAKTVLERWQSAQELQIALEDFVAGSGKRCNTVAIAKWVSDLFAEELSRERGGTMTFKGVGEVILPDVERAEEKAEARPPQDEVSLASLDSGAQAALKDAFDEASQSLPLAQGRGGGSVQTRPPIPAPSTIMSAVEEAPSQGLRLGGAPSEPVSLSSGRARADLIEEGVIDRELKAAADFDDRETILAKEDPRLAEQEAGEGDSPTLDAPSIGAGVAFVEGVLPQVETPAFDDSATIWSKESRGRAGSDGPQAPSLSLVPEVSQVGAEPAPGAPASAGGAPAEADETLIPPGVARPTRELVPPAILLAPPDPSLDEPTRDEGDDLLDLSADAEPLDGDDEDPWDEATVGYPEGQVPPEARAQAGESATGEVTLPPPEPKEETDEHAAAQLPGPVAMDALLPHALRADSRAPWGHLDQFDQDPTRGGDDELWDDKTATNDAYIDGGEDEDDPELPQVATIGMTYNAEPTIAGEPLDAALAESIARDDDDPQDMLDDRTLGADGQFRSPFAESDFSQEPSEPFLEADEAEADETLGDRAAESVDATIAAAPAIFGDDLDEEDDEQEPRPYAEVDDETRRGFEEGELPDDLPNRHRAEHDQRTVAGVTSDFIGAGLVAPEHRYDPLEEHSVDVDLPPGASDTHEARPKPKRGGQGLGAIKLSKVPLEPARPRPAEVPRTRPTPSFDDSEETTEGGSAEGLFDAPVAPSVLRLGSYPAEEEREDTTNGKTREPFRGESVTAKDTEEARRKSTAAKAPEPKIQAPRASSLPAPKAKAPAADPRASAPRPGASSTLEAQDLFAAELEGFEDLPLEPTGTKKPEAKAPAARGAAPAAPPSLFGPKAVQPLVPPGPTGAGPMGIGSTNVPPANLSLSEILSVPTSGVGGRGNLQVLQRGGSVLMPSPLAGGPTKPRGGTGVRQIRETVRSEPTPPVEEAPPPVALLDYGPPQTMEPQIVVRSRRSGVLWAFALVLSLLALGVVGYLAMPALLIREPQLTIRSTPDGADIYLNGQIQAARTPATLDGLQPGVTYELRLERAGYEPITKPVPIPAKARNILVQITLRAQGTAER